MGYKKDIFAVFAYEFEPSPKNSDAQKALFYAAFFDRSPGLGGSDLTAFSPVFGDGETRTLTQSF